MYIGQIFADSELNIDPDKMNEINTVGIVVFALLAIAVIALISWYFLPVAYSKRKAKRKNQLESSNSIWFDSKEAQLHRGDKNIQFEFQSYEFYVCKLILERPNEYCTDTDVFDARSEYVKYKESKRGVEQAVRRLNDKAKNELGLKKDLFKRLKESTTVNSDYRSHIKKL